MTIKQVLSATKAAGEDDGFAVDGREVNQVRVVGNILRQIRQGLPQVLQALPSHPRFAKLSPEQRSTLERAISS